MWWPSTVIGAGAGFAVASIPGALLGALLGQAMDRRLRLQGWEDMRERLGGRPALQDDEWLSFELAAHQPTFVGQCS